MSSRMDRYESSNTKERTEKNKKLYETISDIDVDYIDVNNAIEIKSINKDKLTRSEYQQRRELDKLIPNEKRDDEVYVKEQKVDNRIYDINEILKLARENKLFASDDKKRLINTEYNILTKLDIAKIDENKNTSKESLRQLIDTIYGNSEKETTKEQSPTKSDGLLDDLMVEEPVLSEETSKDILDKEEPKKPLKEEETNEKQEEIKEEQEDTKEEIAKEAPIEEEPKEDEEEIGLEIKSSKKVLIFIIILVILILLAGAYLFYKYFL